MKNNDTKKIGLWSAVALVFSGMVGSGILILPSAMGHCGTWGFFSWILGAFMTYAMFMSFAGVNDYYIRNVKNAKNPDILDFLRLRYCHNTSFLLAFGHFAASAVSAAVTSIALANYFLGLTNGFPLCVSSVASLALLLMFIINLVSFGAANIINLWLTITKLIFFLAIAILGMTYFPTYTPHFESVSLMFSGAGITMFAFMGIEYGIFSSGSIENPEVNAIKATKYGLIFASIVFIGVYTAALFMIPDLSATKTPIYDCAVILLGLNGAKIIGVVAVLSCLTTLNGILVVQGNSLRNFSKKQYLFSFFNSETSQGFPWRGALASLFLSLIVIWAPIKMDLTIFSVTFIGLLYSSVVILEMMLNGISSSGLLAIISCGIMLCNVNIFVIAVVAFVYVIGYLLKYLTAISKEMK